MTTATQTTKQNTARTSKGGEVKTVFRGENLLADRLSGARAMRATNKKDDTTMKTELSTKYTKVVQDTIDFIENHYGKSLEELDITVFTKDEVAERLAEVLRALPKNQENLHSSLTRYDAEECWDWTGAVNPKDGYGLSSRSEAAASFIPGATVMNAHRRVAVLLWGPNSVIHTDRLTVGGDPAKKHVDHACNNVRCVNPNHLMIMPAEINIFKSKKEYCSWGHMLDGAPTYNGSRHCIECAKRRDRWVKDENIAKNAIKRAEKELKYWVTTDPTPRDVLEAKVEGAKAQLTKTLKRIERERASKPTKEQLAEMVKDF